MQKLEKAVLGGGCFWCTEAVFKMLKGVKSVEPGYGTSSPMREVGLDKGPSYAEVSSGNSPFVEVVKIEYDPEQIKFTDLLTVFFGSHDPTTLNRQGNDVGTQYRSVIFYTTEEQKQVAREMIHEINNSSELGKPIVTAIEPLSALYPAEDYHKNYYANHPENQYCELVINPKLEKVQKMFGELLKDGKE